MCIYTLPSGMESNLSQPLPWTTLVGITVAHALKTDGFKTVSEWFYRTPSEAEPSQSHSLPWITFVEIVASRKH